MLNIARILWIGHNNCNYINRNSIYYNNEIQWVNPIFTGLKQK